MVSKLRNLLLGLTLVSSVSALYPDQSYYPDYQETYPAPTYEEPIDDKEMKYIYQDGKAYPSNDLQSEPRTVFGVFDVVKELLYRKSPIQSTEGRDSGSYPVLNYADQVRQNHWNMYQENRIYNNRADEEVSQEELEEEPEEELEEDEEADALEWVQLSVLGLTAFGFIVLGAQLTFGLTNPPNFPQLFGREMHLSDSDSGIEGRSYHNILSFVLQSIDPVDLTFGAMGIGQEECRKRAVCEARRTLGLMSSIESFAGPYISVIPGMKKYSSALRTGQNQSDCASVYSACRKDPSESLPKYLRLS